MASSSATRFFFGSETRVAYTLFGASILLGVILGLAVPGDSSLPSPAWRTASNLVGWTYFSAWSISFYPQIVQNHLRRSVVGLSFDFLALNLLGFTAYSSYNCALFWNPTVRQEYKDANNGSAPGVQTNDVFFGLQAIAATLVTIAQCFVLKRGKSGHFSYFGTATFLVAAAAIVGLAGAAGAGSLSWLAFCTDASYVKLGISLTKYIPQVVLNFRLKSTAGWSIHNVLLDFTGGLLSTVQVIGDSLDKHDWSVATGNPVKFGLGFASMVFDIIFFTQHYCLYPHADAKSGSLQDVDDDGYSAAEPEETEFLFNGIRLWT